MAEKRVKEVESLSPTEQKVYSQLYSQRVINTEDVIEILDDSHKSADYITNLREKGYLQKIRKGVYAIVPPNLVGKGFNPDKFLVARKFKDEYYLSYHSALELHGVAQSIYNTVWITTKRQSSSFNYQSVEYSFLTTKFYFGISKIDHQGVSINVSDREKTFLDCVRRTKYAGGLEELLKSLDSFPSLDWDSFLTYLKKFDEFSLYQKTGFILGNISLRVPEKVLRKLENQVGDKTYYLDREKDSYYVNKWNLMVPKNFKELL